MISKVFIDSDVILDVATGREPFVHDSKIVLSLIENGLALGVMSSNSITNIYYVLRKISTSERARIFIRELLDIVHIISIDHETIKNALDSKFLDFEDGVQNYCALKNQCNYIVTRNNKDYQFSELKVISPKEFNLLFNK
ncbi:MAG: PIN domain-containing protein [Chlorobium sp.]|nr:MAG: PIN domain-containing protein [Chlorobium sp.]